jgi:putative membrane protein
MTNVNRNSKLVPPISLCAALALGAAYASPVTTPGQLTNPPTGSAGDGLGSPTGQSEGAGLDFSDRGFFHQAAVGGMSGVAAGQLAAGQGTDPKVRAFGQQMVTDHTQAGEQLKQLARSKGVNLPSSPDADGEKSLSDLKAKQGKDFDAAYVKQQLKDHRDTIALFEKAARSKDPDIAAFAKQTLPTLRHHLEMAKALA